MEKRDETPTESHDSDRMSRVVQYGPAREWLASISAQKWRAMIDAIDVRRSLDQGQRRANCPRSGSKSVYKLSFG